MQYYVIKDTNNNQYFRGKGVNRWGKYLNQASIYRVLKQAEESLEHIKRTQKFHKDDVEPIIVSIQIIEAKGE